MAANYCTNCGHKKPILDKFCGKCGHGGVSQDNAAKTPPSNHVRVRLRSEYNKPASSQEHASELDESDMDQVPDVKKISVKIESSNLDEVSRYQMRKFKLNDLV